MLRFFLCLMSPGMLTSRPMCSAGLETDKQVLPGSALRQAQGAWRRMVSDGSSASAEQVAIHRTLRAMMPPGVGCELEHMDADRIFAVDIAILHGPYLVAVEVDGPQHFTVTRPYRELGATVLRRKLLQASNLPRSFKRCSAVHLASFCSAGVLSPTGAACHVALSRCCGAIPSGSRLDGCQPSPP